MIAEAEGLLAEVKQEMKEGAEAIVEEVKQEPPAQEDLLGDFREIFEERKQNFIEQQAKEDGDLLFDLI